MQSLRGISVVKVGGAHLDDEAYLERLTEFLKQKHEAGIPLVLVHGGGKEISRLHDRLELPFGKRDGLRVTSEGSMELVSMVLCGQINTRLVTRLQRASLPAVGLSGVDSQLRAALVDESLYGRVGSAPTVEGGLLSLLAGLGQLVVLAPVCQGPDGRPVNVNADAVAQAVASALGAQTLEFVTDVEAVRTAHGASARLSTREAAELLDSSLAHGGMIPKLQASIHALQSGVSSVRIGTMTSLSEGRATELVRP